MVAVAMIHHQGHRTGLGGVLLLLLLLLFQQVNKSKGNTIVMIVGHLFSKLNYNEVAGFIVLAADKRKSSPCLGSARGGSSGKLAVDPRAGGFKTHIAACVFFITYTGYG